MTASERRLPMLYGGHDAGARPKTRERVCAATEGGIDHGVVAVLGAQGTSDMWGVRLTAIPEASTKSMCSPGCYYCCHQRLEVTAPVAFVVARALRDAEAALIERIFVSGSRHS